MMITFYRAIVHHLDQDHNSSLNQKEFTHSIAKRLGDTDGDESLTIGENEAIVIRQYQDLNPDSNDAVSQHEWCASHN